MKKYIIMAVMMLLTMSFVACSENEPMAYEGYPALYFDNKDINYSFFYATSDADRNEVEIPVPWVMSQIMTGHSPSIRKT